MSLDGLYRDPAVLRVYAVHPIALVGIDNERALLLSAGFFLAGDVGLYHEGFPSPPRSEGQEAHVRSRRAACMHSVCAGTCQRRRLLRPGPGLFAWQSHSLCNSMAALLDPRR